MNGAENIERLIKSTRKNLQPRINLQVYESIIQGVESVAESMSINLNIKIIYSPVRKGECVKLGEHTWLIYDQYMGQSMNLLNRIFIEAEDDTLAFTYFHKVLAERLLEVGKLNEALHCAKVYSRHHDRLKGKRIDERLRGTFTSVQEKFYFYHELGHQVHANPDLQPLPRALAKDLVQEQVELKSLSLEALILRVRATAPATWSQADTEAQITQLKKDFGSAEYQLFLKAMLDALMSDDLLEEVFCDVFAADILSAEALIQNIDQAEVFRAIYLGFYHLQVFEYVRRFPELERGNGRLRSDWAHDVMPNIMARSHCMKAHLLFSYRGHLRFIQGLNDDAIAEKVAAFDHQLRNDQSRYYTVIYDIAMKISEQLRRGNRIAKLGKKATSQLNAATALPQYNGVDFTQNELRNIILASTGWKPDASAM